MSKHAFLNKSDLSRFIQCPTSAFYAWQGYTSKKDDDPFLNFLAEEGKSVGHAAHQLFAKATLVDELNTERAAAQTNSLLNSRNATLFEGCVISDAFVARPDVLICRDNQLYLIEVKSKLGNMAQHRAGKMLLNTYGDIRAEWREYVHDLAFQYAVLSDAYPELIITPWLILPEANSAATAEEIIGTGAFTTEGLPAIKQRRKNSVLKFFSAIEAVELVLPEVRKTMAEMKKVWESGKRPLSELRYQCRNCQFRLGNGQVEDDGFHECWGQLAEPKPHIFDLHQLYSLKQTGNKQKLLADEKIAQGKTSLFDIHEGELHGEHSARQSIQLRHQKSGKEWIDPKLGEEISQLRWPIAFLDFETTMSAIPRRAGIRPYQTLPFQYSAHILQEAGSCCHAEWLNGKDRIPTLAFIRSLMSSMKGVGSILVYTDYEVRILKEALELLSELGDEAKTERKWIFDLLHSDRIVDQHDWVYKYFFNPLDMGSGKTSIKKVLPAVWKSNPTLHSHPVFSRYFKEIDGVVLNPYQTLHSYALNGKDVTVREGCAAMQIYREMIYGAGANDDLVEFRLAELLLEYCKLDTIAQWIIFEHWRQHLRVSGTT